MDDFPPSYGSLFNNHASGIGFIDFLPSCEQKTVFCKPKYDTFKTLIDNANEWLQLNPQWEINTCESVEFKDKDGAVYPSKMSYFQDTRHQMKYIRGLRLWLKMFPAGKERVQKIGYVNLVPEAVTHKGFFSQVKYDTLDDVLQRSNNASRTSNIIPGRIITIETQAMQIKSGGVVDPDRSDWSVYGGSQNILMYAIRIFYEVGPPLKEEIGITDFTPDVADVECCSVRAEGFSTLFNKALDWCSRQSALKICNMQSLLRVTIKGDVDTRKMSYTEYEQLGTPLIRTLRVAYIYRQCSEFRPPIQLSCKSFFPMKMKSVSAFGLPVFENLQQVIQRISNWIQATGAEVLNMKTTAVRLSSKGPAYSLDKTYYCDAGHRECYIFIIRVYLKGSYNEPVL